MIGKNFSCNNLGQRKKSDFYETPYSIGADIVNSLGLDWENIHSVLEPACGSGAIVSAIINTIKQYDIDIVATDIRHENETARRDFLVHHFFKSDLIVTNPPFSLADDFIIRAKQLSNKYIALLLPLSYLHGKSRYDNIWTDNEFPLRSVHIYTRYPMLGDPLRDDGKYRTGMMVYAWYVWENDHVGPATIQWIDNNKNILHVIR